MDKPKIDDISWHIKYFESSYLMYICFAAVVILYFVIVYCLKVTNLIYGEISQKWIHFCFIILLNTIINYEYR